MKLGYFKPLGIAAVAIAGIATVGLLVGAAALVVHELTKPRAERRTWRDPEPEPFDDVDEPESAFEPATSEPVVQLQPVVIAAGAFSGKVREMRAASASVDDMLTQATYWWTGSTGDWDSVAQNLEIKEITDIPEADGDLLVLVFAPTCDCARVPTTRVEAAMCLRDSVTSDAPYSVKVYTIGEDKKLTDSQFQR